MNGQKCCQIGSCANPVSTSGTPVVSTAVQNACQLGNNGFGVVGCLEYVRILEAAIGAASVVTLEVFPKAGSVQPVGFLDSRSDPNIYLEEPKVGGSDVTPDYDGSASVSPRSWRVQDQTAEAWRAGINLIGAIAVVISTTVKLNFDLRNTNGAAAEDAEFYWLFLRVS